MREIKLNIDSKVILEKTEKNQRVIIINPEALKNTSATELWDEISGVFGRYDFDMWLAEVIVAKAMNAAAYGGKSADLTDICGTVLYINYDSNEQNWEVFKDNKTFMLLFRNLKVFKIVKTASEELLLEYIG